MDKEKDFIKSMKGVQEDHIETCKILMKIAIVLYTIEMIFAVFCVIYFGCFSTKENGNGANQLICFIHYIKFL
jgi:hypothetical protein